LSYPVGRQTHKGKHITCLGEGNDEGDLDLGDFARIFPIGKTRTAEILKGEKMYDSVLSRFHTNRKFDRETKGQTDTAELH